MSHPEHDQLILLAFNEPAADATTAHVASCPACAAQLASLRDVVAVGRQTQDLRYLPDPPDHVWDAIQSAVDAEKPAAVIRPEPRRRRPWIGRLVAAAAAAAVAVVATWAVMAARDPDPAVVASASLTAYGRTPPAAHGQAEILADGELRLRVADLPPTPGYYQVWLIDPATFDMFTVGVVDDSTDAVIRLPASVDLERYSTIDVSAEAYDNNPAHSGDSLLRGNLD